MITENLLPDGNSYNAGEYGHIVQCVSSQAAWEDKANFKPDAYYLGWIAPENLPMFCRHSKCDVNDTVYKFTDDTLRENFPVGYWMSESYYNVLENGDFIRNSDNSYSTWSYAVQTRFLNQWYPEESAFSMGSGSGYSNIQLYFKYVLYDAGGNFVRVGNFSHDSLEGLDSGSVTSVIDMLYNDGEEAPTYRLDLGSEYGAVSFAADILDSTDIYLDTSTGYKVRIFLVSYIVPNKYYVWAYNNQTQVTIAPFVTVKYNGGSYTRSMLGFGNNYNPMAKRRTDGVFAWTYVGATQYSQRMGDASAGMQGTINISTLDSLHPIAWDGNVLAIHNVPNPGVPSQYEIEFYPMCTRQDVKKAFSLHFRLDSHRFTRSYVPDVTWATDVTPDNEFLALIKTGDIEDDEFKDGLRPWQYENLQENEFDPEEDLPGWEPPGDRTPNDERPDRDDMVDNGDPGEETGKNTNGSMTKFYVMTEAGYRALRTQLAQTIRDCRANPDDTSKFQYLIGTIKKLTGGTEYETARDNFVGEYIVSVRQYAFGLENTLTVGGVPFAGNDTTTMAFGFSGATIPAAAKELNYSIVMTQNSKTRVKNRKGNYSIQDCTFKDFEPYTKYSIRLPYVGEVDIPAHNAVCATIGVSYEIDFSTSTAVAIISAVGGFNTENTVVLAKVPCVIGSSMSITGNDIVKQGDQYSIAKLQDATLGINSMLGIGNAAAGLGSDIAKAGAEGGASGAELGPEGAIVGGMAGAVEQVSPQAIMQQVGNMVNNIQAQRMSLINMTRASREVPLYKAGSTNVSAMVYQTRPVLVVKRMPIFYPGSDGSSGKYGETYGYPYADKDKLSNVKGFFKCANPNLDGIGSTIPATEVEIAQIKDALTDGSYMT